MAFPETPVLIVIFGIVVVFVFMFGGKLVFRDLIGERGRAFHSFLKADQQLANHRIFDARSITGRKDFSFFLKRFPFCPAYISGGITSAMMNTNDQLYLKARELLRSDPDMGKQRLADRLGVKTPTSRRLKHRYLGETSGHSHDPAYQRVRQLKAEHLDWGASRIAQELGISVDLAKVHLARWTGAQIFEAEQAKTAVAPDNVGAKTEPSPLPPVDAPHAGSTLQDTVGQSTRDLCYRGTQVNTLEDLLVYAQVDTSVWEVERQVINKWEVGARNPATGEILTSPLFQIKIWLRRKVVETSLKDLTQSLLAEFKKEAPVRPARVHSLGGGGMLEISIMDLHYGKLCWGEECGRDYNPEIAEKMFSDALEDLLARSSGLKPEKILFPCGNDFYHTDVLGRTTTAGTPQDSAIVWKQAFVQGWTLLAKAIERLSSVAPVQVVVVNGNHDVQSAFHLGEVLKAWFRTSGDVSVDNSPAQRKYVTHHQCLLGLTHGSEEKHSNLGLLLATERPTDWARSPSATREWHVGHFHAKKSLKLLPAIDVGGVLVRVVPSLCPPDAWHASKGYGGRLAAEAYYWDPECGVTATLTHSPV